MSDSRPSVLPLPRLEEITLRPAIAYRGAVAAHSLHLKVLLPFYTFWWVDSGQVEVHLLGQTHRLPATSWIFLPAAVPREHRMMPGTRLLSLSFSLTWPHGGGVLRMLGPLVGTGQADLRDRAGAVIAALDRSGDAGEGSFYQRSASLPDWLDFRGHLAGLAADLVRKAEDAGIGQVDRQPLEPRLRLILEEIGVNPRAGPLPFPRWQSTVGLGRTQLDRLARAHLGRSLRGWRDRCLGEEVRRRLALGRESLKEIAAHLGFSDPAHFHHWTRRHLGEPPSRWRQGV